jgi:hypothetical protein
MCGAPAVGAACIICGAGCSFRYHLLLKLHMQGRDCRTLQILTKPQEEHGFMRQTGFLSGNF